MVSLGCLEVLVLVNSFRLSSLMFLFFMVMFMFLYCFWCDFDVKC